MEYHLRGLVRNGVGQVLGLLPELERVTDGRWVMVEAAPLGERANGEFAVTLRDATSRETFGRALPHLRTLAT